ncbi:MAG: phosphodiester glycosidase family protein, partial [Clostridia bacterium]
NGWQDIHVVQADLNRPYLKFDVLSHENGKSYLQNTYDSAVASDALAAVNADFFSPKSGQPGRGSAIGLEITDGVLRTSPAAYEHMNALYQPKGENTLYFNPFTYSFTVTAPDGASAPITVINKYDSMTGIVMYTRDWGATTPGSEGNVLELVIENGVVTAKNRDVGPVAIPEDGYVLACDLSMHTFLDDYLQTGSAVTLSITTAPNYENIETAVGGGGMILVEGKIPSGYSHTISGTHPRSAVGIDQTGKILTLVAVDGRRTGAAGMTMTQLGYLMADLGCYNAMNLDGGGSTLMTVKQPDGTQKVVNTPSDGSKRAVTNSIGILTDETTPPALSALRLVGDDTAVFCGTSVWLHLEMLDQYGRVMGDVPSEQITWTVTEGSGSIQNDSFYPTAAGTAVIRAESGGLYDELTLTVLDKPYRLAFSAKNIELSGGESAMLWLTGTDAEGRSAGIYPKDVQMTVLNPAVAVMDRNAVKALSYGSTIVTAAMDGVAANLAVTVDGAEAVTPPKGASLPDPKQTAAELTGEDSFRFTVFGNTRTPEKFFDVFMMNSVVSAVKKESDINFFVGNSVNASLLSDLGDCKVTADGFFRFTR